MEWEADPITASHSDYTPQNGMVTFPPGVDSMPLPLSIVDDDEPEFAETLRVELTAIVNGGDGGGVLGGELSAVVTILPSDDPNGALGA